jgi:peroxiredoxin
MKKNLSTAIFSAMLVLATATIAWAVKVGMEAPDFTGTTSQGQQISLSQYRGKYVVLEWHNQGCPYVRKQYESGNMEALQRKWTAKNVVWLSVISSAPGQQGYVTAAQENEYLQKMKAVPTAVLLDPTGKIGHAYEAKTTPNMFVIDPSGKLIYEGAIDDHPTPDPSDVKGSKNYVDAALTEAMAGQPVSVASTRPYGCSVKYVD